MHTTPISFFLCIFSPKIRKLNINTKTLPSDSITAEAAVQHSSAAADSTNHTQDVTYDKSGEAAEAVEAIGENVNVSV